MNILLTGAGGFIGSRLLARLDNENDMFTRALSRSPHPSLDLADEGIVGELTPETDFPALLEGIDMVIHLADGYNAYEHLPATATMKEADRRLETSRRLADAAARKGAQLIYLSTIKTMCGAYAEEILTERTRPRPQSLYGRLKLQTEQAFLSAGKEHGARTVILRFPVVFGHGAGGSMERLRRLAATPWPLPFKGLENRRSLISADSLIDAVMVIIRRREAPGGVYLVHDGALATREIIACIRRGTGRRNRQFALPPILWRLAGRMPRIGALTSRFTRSLELDDGLFRQTFDWAPAAPLPYLLEQWAQAA